MLFLPPPQKHLYQTPCKGGTSNKEGTDGEIAYLNNTAESKYVKNYRIRIKEN
jgi:hypothetical protein